jgi:hypothetical protein
MARHAAFDIVALQKGKANGRADFFSVTPNRSSGVGCLRVAGHPTDLVLRCSCEARASKDDSRSAVQNSLELATRARYHWLRRWGQRVGRGVDLYPPLLGRQLLYRRHAALGGRACERARPRPDAWLHVHAKAHEFALLRTLRTDRRRDCSGAADQGLVEGEEGGLHSPRFLGDGGPFEERFKSALVTFGCRTAGANWSVLRGSCFARAPQDEVGGAAPSQKGSPARAWGLLFSANLA